MKVLVNGDETSMDDGATVVDAVVSTGREPDAKGTAVAVNGEVVPKASWDSHPLREDDRVEVLAAIGGG